MILERFNDAAKRGVYSLQEFFVLAGKALGFIFVKPFFPNTNFAMGLRMMQDMTFDSASAVQDFDWNPRNFNPVFE